MKKVISDDGGKRGARADARRNHEQLLKTASTLFREKGVMVPMKDIAREAGIGVGTLYRHFPHRADLIAAVFRNEVDECAMAAERLCQELSSCEVLERWIALYVQLIVTKRGLASVLHSDESAYADLPAYFETRLVSSLEKLLPHVTGNIRDNTLATDILRGIALLCAPAAKGDLLQTQRLVKLFLKGIRAGDDIHGD
ncbi:TetR/AcrR family transcriptional regulator [Klebsiella variicola]|uniref:TetR/AcrR family transcriptional regulator n=1 Tax=Klebsiella variicola TaxID=244366 RepID=UPI0008FAF45F|nr:TetR/AcrR family transcriptional regulator [Klebsiella variicola]HBQ3196118.1 TetR/AcrR family transcriptional regulator [Klebsiella variicola subsp. variicola]NRE97147.1 TetR/AcrR family transcriptional regulator [Klebsiella variicola]PXL34865.1 TetR/AcrR family transcriptional regulator [Klebsiella variicola]HBR1922447.1 TetR/AcrR family transcriptional regulator [Klebsiella variicola]HBR1926537.1 TetR/AcrR family transcriptional regulator [Klebsiella variicola]